MHLQYHLLCFDSIVPNLLANSENIVLLRSFFLLICDSSISMLKIDQSSPNENSMKSYFKIALMNGE